VSRFVVAGAATRRLVAITDPRYSLEHLVRVVRALPRGRCVVQYRDWSTQEGPREEVARVLRDAAHGSDSLLVVNGDVALALRIGADGVHLGGAAAQRRAADAAAARHVSASAPSYLRAARAALGAHAWISVAAHDDDAVSRAVAAGATAALVSPIWETPGHGPARGLDAIRSARRIAGRELLLYALGGVDARRAASCIDAGADGIAAIRAVFDAVDDDADANATAATGATALVQPLPP
jgi:thiamine-phosphate pyrophosphorylase